MTPLHPRAPTTSIVLAEVFDELFGEVRLCSRPFGPALECWSELELHQALRVVDRLARRPTRSSFMRFDIGARGRWRGATLREDLSVALRRGDVSFLVRDLPAGRPAAPIEPQPPRPDRPVVPELTTWIGVRVVDTGGRALPRERVVVVDPTGVPRPLSTGDQGDARLDAIPPGICDVPLTEYDGRDWGPTGPNPDGDLRLEVSEHVRTAREGECFSSIARDEGFRRLDAFLGHPANAGLLAARRNPNVLEPGDRVTVPDRLRRLEPADTGRQHTFVLARAQVMLRLQLQVMEGDWDRWTLVVGGAEQSAGALAQTSEEQGIVAAIEAAASSASLRLARGDQSVDLELALGALDPWESEAGWRMRLRNLGYLLATDRTKGSERRAVANFQRDRGLAIDGEPGPRTRLALRDAHGC